MVSCFQIPLTECSTDNLSLQHILTVFSLAGATEELDGGSSKILLGNNSGGGAVTLSLITSSMLKSNPNARTHSLTHTHTVDHMHNQFQLLPDLPERDYYAKCGVFVRTQTCPSHRKAYVSQYSLTWP
jgi:hypothetical protein